MKTANFNQKNTKYITTRYFLSRHLGHLKTPRHSSHATWFIDGHLLPSDEDTTHYFLECPSYQRARAGLLLTVIPIIKDIIPDINQNMNRRVKQSLINILLNGDCRLNPESNRDVFEYVQVFIETTGRMSRS